MGITGLIPFLDKASSKLHLQDIRGATVAVDTYCWLHKGAFGCAEKLARGEETDLYVQFCLKYVQMLLSYDIKPILVFDGRHLPAKELTERRRRDSRKQSKQRAAELLRQGKTDEARSHMRRCVDITHEMALRLIRECRLRNVDCIVAPYEADAQMAWLNKAQLAQYIITEDSDLTLFGASKVIFKLDLSGTGLLVEADKLYLAMGCTKQRYTFEKFRRMCILSGCDYLDSLPGIGLAKACKFMLKTEEDDMWKALKKIPSYLNMRNLEVADEYIENFLKAEATFMHMFIYNPLERRMERLHSLQEFNTEERYCSNAGTLMEEQTQAFQLALGNLNPFTLKQLDNWHPDKDVTFGQPTANKNIKRAKHKSIWCSNFEMHSNNNTKLKEPSCALFFKKVDFISKNIQDDINASIKEENTKPDESDIFTMYKSEAITVATTTPTPPQTAPEQAENLKRRRESSSSSMKDFESPPASPVATRARHNPFAKVAEVSLGRRIHSSPKAICENNSLLRVLSPKKNDTNATTTTVTRLSKLKRSIFDDNDNNETGDASKLNKAAAPIEVKSRLFASNVTQVTKLRDKKAPTKDLAAEIVKIETLSQQTQENISQLYSNASPSPKKRLSSMRVKVEEDTAQAAAATDVEEEDVEEVIADDAAMTTDQYEDGSDTKTLKTHNDSAEGNDLDISQHSTTTKTTDADNSISISQPCTAIECITLSDQEDESHPPTISPKKYILNAAIFKQQPRAPRLGLSKPKTTAKTKSVSKTKTNSATTAGLSQNQTRLSMFGFQKRPVLK